MRIRLPLIWSERSDRWNDEKKKISASDGAVPDTLYEYKMCMALLATAGTSVRGFRGQQESLLSAESGWDERAWPLCAAADRTGWIRSCIQL